MRTFAWILFGTTLCMFAWVLWLRWAYMRRGEVVPWPFAGGVAGALGMVCLTGAILLGNNWYVYPLLAAALALTIVEIVTFRRARKRAMSSSAS
jgi:hypothetical protein